jgi:hypothetical protein
VFENRVLRRITGPKREEVVGGWKRLHTEELQICMLHQISSQEELDGQDMQHTWER